MSWSRGEVLGLYRRLLRLHQLLPVDFGSLGRQFVQQEFKVHRDVSKDNATLFLREWNNFATSLENQTQLSSREAVPNDTKQTLSTRSLGQGLSKYDVDFLSKQQLVQLFELYKETQKSSVMDSTDSLSPNDKCL